MAFVLIVRLGMMSLSMALQAAGREAPRPDAGSVQSMRPRSRVKIRPETRESRWKCHDLDHVRVTSSNLRRQIGGRQIGGRQRVAKVDWRVSSAAPDCRFRIAEVWSIAGRNRQSSIRRQSPIDNGGPHSAVDNPQSTIIGSVRSWFVYRGAAHAVSVQARVLECRRGRRDGSSSSPRPTRICAERVGSSRRDGVAATD